MNTRILDRIRHPHAAEPLVASPLQSGSAMQMHLALNSPSDRPLPAGRLFSLEQRVQLKGRHARLASPKESSTYAAGIRTSSGARRTTTVTIAEVSGAAAAPIVRVVQHLRIPARTTAGLSQLQALLGEWRCSTAFLSGPTSGRILSLRLRGDSANPMIGEAQAIPNPIAPLLRTVNAGLVSMYADDGSDESQEFWSQIVRARRAAGAADSQASIESSNEDDGYIVSLALAVLSAQSRQQTEAAQARLPIAA